MSKLTLVPGTPEHSGFVDQTEVLRRLPISRRTLFNWRRSGKIPFVEIGGKIIFHWGNVEAALLRMEKGGAL